MEERIIKLILSRDDANILIAYELLVAKYGEFRYSGHDFLEKAGIRITKSASTRPEDGRFLAIAIKRQVSKLNIWSHSYVKIS